MKGEEHINPNSLNASVPPEALVKWSLKEAQRHKERAESVARYARQLEAQVKDKDARIADLEAVIASSPMEEAKAEKKAREKREKTLKKHLKKYLGLLKTEVVYIEEISGLL